MPETPEVGAMDVDADSYVEHVEMVVRYDDAEKFEQAYEQYRNEGIGVVRGLVSVRLMRCVEFPVQYLHLVEWASLEDHFAYRGSREHTRFVDAIKPFWDTEKLPETGMVHYRWVSRS